MKFKKNYRQFVWMGGLLIALAPIGCKSDSGSDGPADAGTTAAEEGGTTTTDTTTTAENENTDNSNNTNTASKPKSVDDAVVNGLALSLTVPKKLSLIPPAQKGASLALAEEEGEEEEGPRKTETFVEEKSLEGLKQAEQIMCYMSQTRFELMANKGAYTALVNGSACEDDSARNGGGGQVQLMPFNMNVIKEEGKPLVARGLVETGRDSVRIMAKIAEGPSNDNPLGIFRFNWQFEDANKVAGNKGGLIESSRDDNGNITLKFFEKNVESEAEWNYTRDEEISAIALLTFDENGKNTGGKVSSFKDKKETQDGQSRDEKFDYNVAFNNDFIRRTGTHNGTAEDKCLSRTEFKSKVFNYEILDAEGKGVDLNSGFPAEIDVDGKTIHAHASFWGVWAEGNPTLAAGTKIYKVDWENGEKARTEYESRYQVVSATLQPKVTS